METRKVGGFDGSETSRKALSILLEELQAPVTASLEGVVNPCAR